MKHTHFLKNVDMLSLSLGSLCNIVISGPLAATQTGLAIQCCFTLDVINGTFHPFFH